MSYSIVIPSRNVTNLEACLNSMEILDAKSLKRVIVVDDDESGEIEQITLQRGVRRIQGIKPFIFARNVNLGIATAGDDDMIILNDDTRLQTDFGFGFLSVIANENPQFGIISAGITGAVGNLEQIAQPGTQLRTAKHHTVVFVCVYIRHAVLDRLADNFGYAPPMWLDETFEAYGYDDDDMCERVRRTRSLLPPHDKPNWLKLGVFDGCVVEHGVLESSYRGNRGNTGLSDLRPNHQRFVEKWGFEPGRAPTPTSKAEPAKIMF